MLGTVAVAVPVPPVALVPYHSRFVPVAVKATAVPFWQYVTAACPVGAGVLATTCTVIVALGPSQVLDDWLAAAGKDSVDDNRNGGQP